jgi:hypothetical protein
MNNLAVLLATSTDPKIRNPKEAVSLAQKAVEIEADNPTYLDTLATVYFEAGQPGTIPYDGTALCVFWPPNQ